MSYIYQEQCWKVVLALQCSTLCWNLHLGLGAACINFPSSVEFLLSSLANDALWLHNCFGSKIYQIFDCIKMKVSYCCMPNLQQAISSHNKLHLTNTRQRVTSTKHCDYQSKDSCSLYGHCLASLLIYQAVVTVGNISLTERTFKKRFANHKTSFTDEDKRRSSTELNNSVWALRDQGIDFDIKRNIVRHALLFNAVRGSCLWQKFYIIFKPHMSSLNRWSEMFSSCGQRTTFYWAILWFVWQCCIYYII